MTAHSRHGRARSTPSTGRSRAVPGAHSTGSAATRGMMSGRRSATTPGSAGTPASLNRRAAADDRRVARPSGTRPNRVRARREPVRRCGCGQRKNQAAGRSGGVHGRLRLPEIGQRSGRDHFHRECRNRATHTYPRGARSRQRRARPGRAGPRPLRPGARPVRRRGDHHAARLRRAAAHRRAPGSRAAAGFPCPGRGPRQHRPRRLVAHPARHLVRRRDASRRVADRADTRPQSGLPQGSPGLLRRQLGPAGRPPDHASRRCPR